MKWDFQIAFTVRRGRKRVFRIEQILPFLRYLRDAHYQHARSCYDKSRFTSRGAAMNAEWFKKNKEQAYPHEAYQCEVCDGWHLTTLRDENGKKLAKGVELRGQMLQLQRSESSSTDEPGRDSEDAS